MRTFIVVIFVLIHALSATAQNRDKALPLSGSEQTGKLEILFQVNSALIDTVDVGNSKQFKELRDIINNNDLVITDVTIRACSSPEGPVARNSFLAKSRRDALLAYFHHSFPKIDPSIVHTASTIAGWSDVAADQKNNPDLSERAIEIMGSASTNAGKEQQIKRLDNGSVYNYLKTHVLPQYRYGYYHVTWHETIREEAVPEPTPVPVIVNIEEPEAIEKEVIYEPVIEEPVIIPPITLPKKELLVKSNALYLAATVFNIGIEYRLSPRLSIDLPFYYSPYEISDRFKLRVMGTQPELRYWLGETFRQGHFIGLHAHVAGFNVALWSDHRYQDPEHALWGAGLSYGYFLPLKRNWNMEFTLGAGYANIRYDVFNARGDKKFLRDEKKNYWGITRIGVSFGYMFNLQSLWRR